MVYVTLTPADDIDLKIPGGAVYFDWNNYPLIGLAFDTGDQCDKFNPDPPSWDNRSSDFPQRAVVLP